MPFYWKDPKKIQDGKIVKTDLKSKIECI
jgi:hypothetical protein